MMRRLSWMAFFVLVAATATYGAMMPKGASTAEPAAVERAGEQKAKEFRERKVYRCRIVNKSGTDVKVAVVGYYNTMFVGNILPDGAYTDVQFFEGDKAISAFADFEEKLIVTKKVVITG